MSWVEEEGWEYRFPWLGDKPDHFKDTELGSWQKAAWNYREGWLELKAENARLKADLDIRNKVIESDCETDEAGRKLARKVLSDMAVYGDSYGVPTTADIIESLTTLLSQARGALEKYGRHLFTCHLMNGQATWCRFHPEEKKHLEWDGCDGCTCGLDATLSALGEAK
jgi:hypothetical protein